MLRFLLLAAFWIASLAATNVRADAGQHPVSLWQVDGRHNRVYLLGSIHLLRERDHPLPGVLYEAYDDAEVLFMELDFDDVDPVADQALIRELGMLANGRRLADILGPALFAKASRLAEEAAVPLGLLEYAEPWFAAVNVEMMLLMRAGFSQDQGIEAHFAARAAIDQKEIFGFETTAEQLGFLDSLSIEAQKDMFIQSLVEGISIGEVMDSLVEAWHRGDTQFMEENLLADMQEMPELNQVIVVDRNIAWTNRIEDMLDDRDDYLVIVGALHLVGNSGVPALLQQRGYAVRQWVQPE